MINVLLTTPHSSESVRNGNPTHTPAQMQTLVLHSSHALRQLHLHLRSASHMLLISIHNEHRPANLVIINVYIIWDWR